MKKLAIMFLCLGLASPWGMSQTLQVVKKTRVSQDEVPAKVLKSFVRDFQTWGGLDTPGSWTVEYGFQNDSHGRETVAKPMAYTFRMNAKKANNAKPVIATYFPDGEAKDVEGLGSAPAE